ncbi:MAG: ParB/RepB/Spo0J family partition protein [Winkia neuii]|uniref:ParB/RepB/Spo0J family partition protein n=1 Tax=Winkia neuii TaxID=33007 RepID=UPI002900F920|nr:ParB/RepB/Spo0J family partition protein [Winkia neuii]MDU3134219.1 ParB/RepB/Spo0J family partition protein [Winkia neuii]
MSARRSGGLGRGLGALIPSEQREPEPKKGKPIDIFFPDSKEHPSGGSRSDLLSPRKRPKKAVKKKEAATKAGRAASSGPSGNVSRETNLVKVPGASFGEIAIADIIPNAKQPRRNFDEQGLDELSASIEEVGVLQPIVVRPLKELGPKGEHYELIMGERRWRGSKQAGKVTIPAIVRKTAESDLLRDALLENLHRANLNPLEEAAAYQQLMEDFDCTQAELAVRIKRSRPQIANTVRLLKLPAPVQRRVAAGVLSAGHARALLGLSEVADMERFASRIVSEGWSVRSTEEQIALFLRDGAAEPIKKKSRTPIAISATQQSFQDQLGNKLDTRVSVKPGKKRGKIVIEFADEQDFARIAGLLK